MDGTLPVFERQNMEDWHGRRRKGKDFCESICTVHRSILGIESHAIHVWAWNSSIAAAQVLIESISGLR